MLSFRGTSANLHCATKLSPRCQIAREQFNAIFTHVIGSLLFFKVTWRRGGAAPAARHPSTRCKSHGAGALLTAASTASVRACRAATPEAHLNTSACDDAGWVHVRACQAHDATTPLAPPRATLLDPARCLVPSNWPQYADRGKALCIEVARLLCDGLCQSIRCSDLVLRLLGQCEMEDGQASRDCCVAGAHNNHENITCIVNVVWLAYT